MIESEPMKLPDWALLSAYLLAAVLGTWTSALLLNDGAIFLTAGWLGDSWNLYFSQDSDRVVSMLLTYGPVWALHSALGLSSDAYMAVAHAFYFAVPLGLWLILRAVEGERLFSRLYLAITLPMIYFPTEQIQGTGIWLIWLALVADPARPMRQSLLLTVPFGVVLGLTHPAIAMMSILYLAVGVVLVLLRRPVPRGSLIAAALMTALLMVAYVLTSRFLSATNPTVVAALAVNRYAYVDPLWMVATLVLFPVLAALWLLLLAPAAETVKLRWRLPPRGVLVVAAIGVWFAAAGTAFLLWLYARHTAPHVLALVIALALVAPAAWAAHAARPLALYGAIAAVAVVSYNADIVLFGRFVDRHIAKPGEIEAETVQWPPRYAGPTLKHIALKWGVGDDYVRDFVAPVYDWHRVTLAFYSYFRTDRQSILFHRLGKPGEWLPYHCSALERVKPRDQKDAAFVAFLSANYCVR
jgi:hypothetical protein